MARATHVSQPICCSSLSAVYRWDIYSRRIFVGILPHLPSMFRGRCRY